MEALVAWLRRLPAPRLFLASAVTLMAWAALVSFWLKKRETLLLVEGRLVWLSHFALAAALLVPLVLLALNHARLARRGEPVPAPLFQWQAASCLFALCAAFCAIAGSPDGDAVGLAREDPSLFVVPPPFAWRWRLLPWALVVLAAAALPAWRGALRRTGR